MERPGSGNASARMDPAPARTRGFATLALATLAVLSVVAASLAPAANAATRRTPSRGASSLHFAETVFPGAGGEPNVSISPDGKTVLVDGLGGTAQGNDQPAALWRSTDGGKTFTRIKPHF